ncbi:MAG: hypothetical protein ACLS4Z_03115 [Christensenellaceae bacterium]
MWDAEAVAGDKVADTRSAAERPEGEPVVSAFLLPLKSLSANRLLYGQQKD